MAAKILVQHYNEYKDKVWSRFVGNAKNPCYCGSNLFHYEYDGETMFGVCNSCNTKIYTVKSDYVKEKLAEGVWS